MKDSLIDALTRLGGLALDEAISIDLLVVGGGVMVLEFSARLSTRDLDAVVINNVERSTVSRYANVIAREKGWPEDWLNDAAKGFISGTIAPVLLLHAPGIRVLRPSLEHLLAMKLCAWRDDVDVSDAVRLLKELSGSRDEIWAKIVPHLIPGSELKARYGFEDLWETRTH